MTFDYKKLVNEVSKHKGSYYHDDNFTHDRPFFDFTTGNVTCGVCRKTMYSFMYLFHYHKRHLGI